MKDIVVSIITPMYNSRMFIEDTILSILSQTYQKWELIIIDDNSLDDGKVIVKKYMSKDIRINLIELDKNSGPAYARNRGITLAQGRYITFIDSDDIWYPEFLEKQVKFISENNYVITCASYKRMDSNLNKDFGDFLVDNKISYTKLLINNQISCLTVMYDSNKVGKRLFNETYMHEDYIMWLDILRDFKYAYGLEEVLAIYRIREKSISRNKIKSALARWRIYRDIEGFGIFKSGFYFFCYIISGLLKNAEFFHKM